MSEMLQAARIKRKKRDYVFLFLLLLIFLLLTCSFLPGWISVNTPTSELPFSLHSVKEADYTIDRNMAIIPEIGLDIIEDIMRDNNVSEAEIAVRVGTLSSSLLTPVPRSTGILSVPNTPVPATPVNVPTFSTTKSPAPTSLVPTVSQPTPPIPTSAPPTPQIVYHPTTQPTEEDPSPSISLNSSVSGYADKDSSGTITLKDELQYQILVSNTGDVLLSSVHINDNSFGSPITCPSTTLAAGANMTCTADLLHTITLAEANAGSVKFASTALGTYDGTSYSKSATLTTTVTQNPMITLEKELESFDDNDFSSSITEGDSLWYKFKIINTGNVTVDNLSVSDDSFGLTVTCPAGALDPGAFAYCHATTAHTVTSAEATAGKVTNSATASAQFNTTLVTDSDTLNTPVSTIPTPPPSPSISLVKSLASFDDNDSSSDITQGDALWYQFTVTNSGNVPLTNITVSDNTFSISVTCPSTTLAPSASTVCTANTSHIITLVEANAGQVTNSATASGDYNSTAYTANDTLNTIARYASSAVISGQVREDLDGNGDLNDPDPGLANVKIELTSLSCSTGVDCPFTYTDANGDFTFSSIADGLYTIIEYDPAEYTSTAESDGTIDNAILAIILGGASSTGHVFLDKADTPACTAPDPVNGFVASTIPANGAVNVPMTTTTITIVYNQAMMASGGQSIDRVDKYAFNNESTNKKVTLSSATYDPATYTVILVIDTTDSNWQAGSLYELTIKTVQNTCGTSQTSITRTFTTQ